MSRSSAAAPARVTMQLQTARVPYTACPLCGLERAPEAAPLLVEADCTRHPLHREELPGTIRWVGCERCGHVHTDGYLDPEAGALLLERANPAQLPGADADHGRRIAARIVERVAALRGGAGGRWLEVGFGAGALLATAEEFGFEALGLDVRPACVEGMRALGYAAEQGRLEDLDAAESFDVVSLADVLEHVPFPAETLAAARRVLRPGGLLFVSAPNLDCLEWRVLHQAGKNPYWAELEHYHNFSREHLCWLLDRVGFEPRHYAVSERYRCGMELVAERRS